MGITYNVYMVNIYSREKNKRNELIWALSIQDYTNAEMARIFNINRATITRIIKSKPKQWLPKWKKI